MMIFWRQIISIANHDGGIATRWNIRFWRVHCSPPGQNPLIIPQEKLSELPMPPALPEMKSVIFRFPSESLTILKQGVASIMQDSQPSSLIFINDCFCVVVFLAKYHASTFSEHFIRIQFCRASSVRDFPRYRHQRMLHVRFFNSRKLHWRCNLYEVPSAPLNFLTESDLRSGEMD